MVTALLQLVRARGIFDFNRRGTSPTPPAKHLTHAAIIAMACMTLLATACRSNSTAAAIETLDVRAGSLAVAAQEGGGTDGKADEKAAPEEGPKPTLLYAGNLGGHCKPITCMDFSPDGKLLASGSKDGTVRVWDVGTGALVKALPLGSRSDLLVVHDIEFSPDGTKLACGAGDARWTYEGLWVWTVPDWKLSRMAETEGAVLSVSWSSDSVAIAVETFHWRSSQMEGVHYIESRRRAMIIVAVSGGIVRVLEEKQESTQSEREESAHHTCIYRPTYASAGSVLFCGQSECVDVLDPYTRNVRLTMNIDEWEPFGGGAYIKGRGTVIDYSADGSLVAIQVRDSQKVVNVGAKIRGDNGTEFTLAGQFVGFLPNGRLLEVEKGKLSVVTTGNPQLKFPFPNIIYSYSYLTAVSDDGSHLACRDSDTNEIVLVSLTDGEERRRIGGHAGASMCVAARPGTNHVASGGSDGSVCLWDAESVSYIRTMRGGSSVKVGEVETTRPDGHDETVHAVTFSPDGKLLASGSADRRVILWDPNTGEALRELKGHHHTVTSLAFSPDGKLIASGSDDCTVRVWEVETGKQLKLLRDMNGPVASVVFSADGKLLLAGGTLTMFEELRGQALWWSTIDYRHRLLHQELRGNSSQLLAAFGSSGFVIFSEGDSGMTTKGMSVETAYVGPDSSVHHMTLSDHQSGWARLPDACSLVVADIRGVTFAALSETDNRYPSNTYTRDTWAFNRIAANADKTRFVLAGDPKDPVDTIQVWRIKQ